MRSLRLLAIAALVTLTTFGCAQEVKLGVVLSESGEIAAYSASIEKGIDLAAEEVNASGEVGTLTLMKRDDGNDPEAARNHARELIDTQNVSAIVGGVSSTTAIAMAEVTNAEGVVLLSPSASSPTYSAAGMYSFRNFPSDVVEGTSIAQFARDLGLESVAVFAVDNEYGRGLRNVFVDKFESKYRKVVGDFDFNPGDQARVDEMAEQIRELEPDGVYIVALGEDILRVLRMLDSVESKAVRMATSSVTPAVLSAAGEAADRLLFAQPNTWDANSKDPKVSAFVEAYRGKYGEDPDLYAAHGYDAIKLVADAAVRGGSGHPKNIFVGITGIRDFTGAAGRVDFDANGDVTRSPRMFVFDGGESKPYDAFVEAGGTVIAP